MVKKSKTLDDWMWENKQTNTSLSKDIEDQTGEKVAISTIGQLRNKTNKFTPSGRLAKILHEFTNKEVSLEEILGVK